ncbi:response regulator transcription factor [Microlunatus ginsengisoli]|uniref:Response regulator transcription factor n=1 Tax=Microlunatus ginsengisoli TaxID=363863 RepID=A0ABP6ZQ25_9ACTN
MSDPLRVLIVDDHPAFVEGLKILLTSAPTVEVIAAAQNGREAVDRAAELQPDVILMDLHMPAMNGIEATQLIVDTSPHIAVLVLTMLEDDDSVFSAMRAGARGYLLKGASRAEIVRAVAAVGDGEAIFGPGIAERVLGFFARGESVRAATGAFPQLTEREREILGLIAAGKDNSEIAQELYLSLKTVRNHVSNIFTKLQVAHRAQLIVMAREAGLGRGGDRPRPGGADRPTRAAPTVQPGASRQ